MACRIQKTREWATRLSNEASFHEENCFLTLTFREEDYPVNMSVSKRDLQLFFKRLRKEIEPSKIKYYACGEYGEKLGRPHYHAIIFGWCPDDLYLASYKDGKPYYASHKLLDIWSHGFNTVGSVTYDSCQYVAGYVRKKLGTKDYWPLTPPFQLQSNGLGLDFAKKYEDEIKKKSGVVIRGKHHGLPRYYARKLEIDKELLKAVNWRKNIKKIIQAGYKERIDDWLRLEISDRRRREKELGFFEKLNKRDEV